LPKSKKQKALRSKIPMPVRRKIRAKGITFKSVRNTKKGVRIHAETKQHDFVEVWSPKGKLKGMILRNKGEKFWSVWREHTVLTVPFTTKKGMGKAWRVIGSVNKARASQLLHQKVLKRS